MTKRKLTEGEAEVYNNKFIKKIKLNLEPYLVLPFISFFFALFVKNNVNYIMSIHYVNQKYQRHMEIIRWE